MSDLSPNDTKIQRHGRFRFVAREPCEATAWLAHTCLSEPHIDFLPQQAEVYWLGQ